MEDNVFGEEVAELLSNAHRTNRDLFRICCFLTASGLNLKEAFDVTWKDLHFADEGKEVLKRWNKKQKKL